MPAGVRRVVGLGTGGDAKTVLAVREVRGVELGGKIGVIKV